MAVMYYYPGMIGQLPDGSLAMWSKSMTGLRMFAAGADFDVIVAAAVEPVDELPQGAQRFVREGRLHPLPLIPGREREQVAAIADDLTLIMTLLSVDKEWLLDLGVPVSFVAENTLRMRVDQLMVRESSLVKRARSAFGLLRRERTLRSMVMRSAGLECNGPGAWRSYAHLSSHAVQFNDGRITDADIAASRCAPPRDDSVLSVAFSGRWTVIKGVSYVLDAARLAHQRGVRARFSVLGSGELEPEIRAASLPNLDIVGYLDFETQWKTHVRETVDLMLLPHVQGDPSGSYFESLGCGVPVLGFRNESLTPLADAGLGWVVRRGDVAGLVDVIARLADDRSDLYRARAAALDYMASRTLERDDVRRLDFVHSVQRAP